MNELNVKAMAIEVANKVCEDCERLHVIITIPGAGVFVTAVDAIEATNLALSLTNPFVNYLSGEDKTLEQKIEETRAELAAIEALKGKAH